MEDWIKYMPEGNTELEDVVRSALDDVIERLQRKIDKNNTPELNDGISWAIDEIMMYQAAKKL